MPKPCDVFLGCVVHNLFHISHYIGDVVDNILGKLLLVLKSGVQHLSQPFGCPPLTFDTPFGDYIVIVC